TACLIVRDEADFLADCLASVRRLTDDIVVVDTGSRDRTPAIAREFGCRVYALPWQDDFSAARNCALTHACGDWALCLDADERVRLLCSREELAAFLTTTPSQALKTVIRSYVGSAANPAAVIHDARIALFRTDPAIRFERRVHEDITESLARRYGQDLNVGGAPLEIEHVGYLDAVVQKRAKRQRNIRLLQLDVEENGSTPWNDYCLGTEWLGCERWSDAATLFERVVNSAPDAPFWELAAYSLAFCHLQLLQFDDCSRVCELALERDGADLARPFSTLRAAAVWKSKRDLASLLDSVRNPSGLAREDYEACSQRYVELFRQLWPQIDADAQESGAPS
ncbi:MAG: glycosyltransferase family 2 protein, partial [Bacilli bacterium]